MLDLGPEKSYGVLEAVPLQKQIVPEAVAGIPPALSIPLKATYLLLQPPAELSSSMTQMS